MLSPKTRIRDFTSVTAPRNPDATSFFLSSLRVSGDRASMARDQAGVEIILSMRAEHVLLNRVPVNNHLYPVWLYGSVPVNSSRLQRRYLFVVPVYILTDCRSPEVKHEFYQKLSRSLRGVGSTDVTIAAGLETQLGHLEEMERHI